MNASNHPLCRGLRAVATALILCLSPMVVFAQSPSTGTITGRVLNERTRQYLRAAELTIVGTNHTTTSGDAGVFMFLNVPAGTVRIAANFAGLDPFVAEVTVQAGQTTTCDINLTSKSYDHEVVTLGAFVVATEREGNAKAIMEQRRSLDLKQVIAADAFGDVSEGNLGEFIKLLPGIQVDYVEADARTISIDGMDPKYTQILMDGARVANAASSGLGRAFEMESLSVASLETIELTKTPTPEVAGSALAGMINVRSKGAFDRRGRQIRFATSIAANSMDLTLAPTPGWDNQERRKILPNLFMEYSDTFLKGSDGRDRLGIVLGYNYSYTFSQQKALTAAFGWDADATNNATELPRVTSFGLRDSPKTTTRRDYSARLDFYLTPELRLWTRWDYNTYQGKFFSRDWSLSLTNTYNAPGAAAAYIDTTTPYSENSQTAAGTSTLSLGGGATDKHGYTSTPAVGMSYGHGAFRADVMTQYSRSTNWYSDLPEGFFWHSTTSALSNLRFRFDRQGPADDRLNITQLAGPDWRSLSSYANGFTASHTDRHGVDEQYTGRVDCRYDWAAKLPVLFKGGLNLQQSIREVRYLANLTTYTHLGADGLANTADDAPGLYGEPIYRMRYLQGGNIDGVQNLDRFAMAQELKNHPEYWQAPTAATLLNAQLRNGNKVRENIQAFYFEPIVKVTPRLQIAPGVRVERTSSWGRGPSDIGDPAARRALGLPATGTISTDTIPYQLARYSPKSGYTDPYTTWLRYLHSSYTIVPGLIFRASFNESISRPDYNRMITGITINNESGTPPTATLNNPDLKPEHGRNVNYSLEFYPKSEWAQLLSVSFTRRDMTDLIRTQSVDIPTGGSFLNDPQWGGWRISTIDNVAKAHISSLALDYRSPALRKLPGILSGVSVFGNYTTVMPDNVDNFLRPTNTANGGVSFRWRRVSASWKTNWQGFQRTSVYATNGTANFNIERLNHDINADFKLYRNVTVFLTGRNIFNRQGGTYSTRSDYMTRWIYTGTVWTLGMKGTF